MDIQLIGKKAFVCGGSQGIGKAIAEELATLGASVTLVARSKDKLIEVVAGLAINEGQTHDYIVADFKYPNEAVEKLQVYLNQHPEAHILVNNAGGPTPGNIVDAQADEFRVAFNMHVITSQLFTQAILPAMKKGGYGRIVNLISVSAKEPVPGLGVSNTIRGAMANWSKTMAQELGVFGITVNNVLPGFTNTERLRSLFENRGEVEGKTAKEVKDFFISIIPARRIGEPAEIANAVAFLASPAASYINGINLPVDGGKTWSL